MAIQLDINNMKSKCRITNKTFGPYENGCLETFTEFLQSKEGLIAGIVSIVTLLQIVVIVITCQLLKNVKKPQSCAPFY